MKIMIPLTKGFEDIEATTVIDVLRRANIDVEIIGIVSSVIESKHKVRIVTDKIFTQISPKEYDGIVIVGGPGYDSLNKITSFLNMIKTFYNGGKLVAAIGESVSILAKQGLLDNKKAVITPGMEKLLAYPRDQPVIVEDNIITSQGPGTSMDFALAIVKKLKGDSVIQKLKKELVVK